MSKAPPASARSALAGPSPLVRVLRRNAGGAVGGGAVMPGAVAQEEEVASTKTRLLTVPRIFSLGIAANTAHATKPEIADTLEGIDETLNLRDVFDGLGTAWEGTDARFQLVGLTAFYEQHYVCYCYSQARRHPAPPRPAAARRRPSAPPRSTTHLAPLSCARRARDSGFCTTTTRAASRAATSTP